MPPVLLGGEEGGLQGWKSQRHRHRSRWAGMVVAEEEFGLKMLQAGISNLFVLLDRFASEWGLRWHRALYRTGNKTNEAQLVPVPNWRNIEGGVGPDG